MKQPKCLTREQKEIVSDNFLNVNDWFLVEETDFHIKVVHRNGNKFKYLDKFARKVGNRCILKDNLISTL